MTTNTPNTPTRITPRQMAVVAKRARWLTAKRPAGAGLSLRQVAVFTSRSAGWVGHLRKGNSKQIVVQAWQARVILALADLERRRAALPHQTVTAAQAALRAAAQALDAVDQVRRLAR